MSPGVRRRLLFVFPAALLGLAAARGGAQEATGGPLEQLNARFRATYKAARADVLAHAGPVLIADFNRLVLVRGKERQEVTLDFRRYDQLKMAAHVPFGLYLELAGQPEGPLEPAVRERLFDWRLLIARADEALPKYGFDEPQRQRQREILKKSLAYVDAVLAAGQFVPRGAKEFTRGVEPLLRQNVYDAARVQIDLYHAQVLRWKEAMPPEEWARLHVIVMGSQMPRKENIAVQYFAKWLGEPGEGRRLVYAEAIYDDDKAMSLLGTHLLDRRAAEAFFADPQRLDRDLLADGAAAYLKTLDFGPK